MRSEKVYTMYLTRHCPVGTMYRKMTYMSSIHSQCIVEAGKEGAVLTVLPLLNRSQY